MKHRFPFRLGTTSYIIPADILPNVDFLAPRVDDIELLLFETDEVSNLPDADTVDRLVEARQAHGISYTVHLPLDLAFGALHEETRRASVAQFRRIARITAPIEPFCYILHFNGTEGRAVPHSDLPRWRAALKRSVADLLETGVAPGALSVETLAYPYDWVADIVLGNGLSVCLDVGHLLVGGYDLAAHLDRYLAHCRVVHLHGVEGGQDHLDISRLPVAVLKQVLAALCEDPSTPRVLTLEIFSRDHFETSMMVINDQH